MPNMTAQDIVTSAQQQSGLIDPSKVITGFADTISYFPDSLNWLSACNRAFKWLMETGFNKCQFTIPLVSGTQEYYITPEITRVESAWMIVNGRVQWLEKSSIGDLDGEFSGQAWRNSTGTFPYRWYMIGTKSVGFFPKPLGSGITVTFLGDATMSPMVLRADVPAQMEDDDGNVITLDEEDPLPDGSNVYSVLPTQYHEAIPSGGVAIVLRALNDQRAGSFFQDFGNMKTRLMEDVNTRLRSDIEPFQVNNQYRSGVRRGIRHNSFR